MGVITFGTEDDTVCIVDIAAKGNNGEPLCLGYKFTVKHFIGPVWLRDDGLVMKVKLENSYYDLPDADTVKAMQEEGLLPTPLPSYEIPWWRYAYGYLVWIVIAGMVVAGVLGRVVKAMKAKGGGGGAGVPPVGPPATP
jgi:hypothetical protein